MRVTTFLIVVIVICASLISYFSTQKQKHVVLEGEVVPCLPSVQLTPEQREMPVEKVLKEVIRRLERSDKLLSKSTPENLWRALENVEEAKEFLDLILPMGQKLKIRQIDLKEKLIQKQLLEIKNLQLQIARQKHYRNREKIRDFQRYLLKYVPLREHPLHQKLRLQLGDW